MDYINTSQLGILQLQLKDVEQELACAEKLVQSKRAKAEDLKKLLYSQTPQSPAQINTSEITQPETPQIIAIKNGKLLPGYNRQNTNEDDFDVILDMTTTCLRYRKDPAKHTKLNKSKLKGIGMRRIEILSHLLEHPLIDISIESASSLPNQLEIIDPNTLAKTICLLRKALGQSGTEDTYILTKDVWGQRYRSAYRLNEKRNYLVIKEKNEEVIGKS